MRLFMRFFTLFFFLSVTVAFTGESATDPSLRWIPSKTKISAERYAVHLEYLTPQIEEALSEARARPVFGIRIVGVNENSQASAAGLAVGDVITKLDGVVLPEVSGLRQWRNGKTQTLTVWTATAGEREIKIHPGMIGFQSEESWSLLHGYLATREVGAAWEHDLMLAAVARNDNLQMMESALVAAQEKGCNHPMWIVAASALAVDMGRFPEARAFARVALTKVSAPERLPIAKQLYIALVAGGLMGEAQALARQYDVLSYDEDHAALQRRLDDSVEPMRVALAAHPILPLDELLRTRAEETDHARTLTYLSGPQQRIAEDLAKLDPDGDLVLKGMERTERLNRDGALSFASHHDRLDLTRIGPLMRDLDVAMTSTLTWDRVTFKTSLGAVAIGVVDHHAGEGSIILRLQISETSGIQVRVANMPEYEVNRKSFLLGRPHRLRICIRDYTLALLVDGFPVYHGPLLEDPATRKLGIDLYTRDLMGTWTDLKWRGVLTAQDLPEPPAQAGRPKQALIGANDF